MTTLQIVLTVIAFWAASRIGAWFYVARNVLGWDLSGYDCFMIGPSMICGPIAWIFIAIHGL